MAGWWKEAYDVEKHPNRMKGALDGVYTFNFDETPTDPLISKEVYFVRAAGVTLQFLSLRQLEIALEYFDRHLKGSSRIEGGIGAADHWEVQQWFERLPKGLERKERKAEVTAALRNALEDFTQ